MKAFLKWLLRIRQPQNHPWFKEKFNYRVGYKTYIQLSNKRKITKIIECVIPWKKRGLGGSMSTYGYRKFSYANGF